ncbi:MAG: hypothetical protein NUW37_08105 [Planctomycetes bacterium]|nr:hypothetical protein [Planctomycetota bacterium]
MIAIAEYTFSQFVIDAGEVFHAYPDLFSNMVAGFLLVEVTALFVRLGKKRAKDGSGKFITKGKARRRFLLAAVVGSIASGGIGNFVLTPLFAWGNATRFSPYVCFAAILFAFAQAVIVFNWKWEKGV